MKKIFYPILIMSLLVACESTTKNFGEKFAVQNPVSVNEVLAQLTSGGVITNEQIEGKVEKSCMSEGCWFTIKDSTGIEIKFDVKDKKFKVPTNSPGQTVVVLADAARDSSSEHKIMLSVKGMMFK